jgi:hypothetical protein
MEGLILWNLLVDHDNVRDTFYIYLETYHLLMVSVCTLPIIEKQTSILSQGNHRILIWRLYSVEKINFEIIVKAPLL